MVALVEQTQTADVADSMSSLSINAQAHSGVAVQTLKEQLERYFGEYPQLLTLFESVCSAALLRRLQKVDDTGNALQAWHLTLFSLFFVLCAGEGQRRLTPQ